MRILPKEVSGKTLMHELKQKVYYYYCIFELLIPLLVREYFAQYVSTDDILAWWRRNEPRFPVVAHLARRYLAVPYGSIASESLYSEGGFVLNRYRTRMASDLFEMLLFLFHNRADW
mgnify:CR=1 FL=1